MRENDLADQIDRAPDSAHAKDVRSAARYPKPFSLSPTLSLPSSAKIAISSRIFIFVVSTIGILHLHDEAETIYLDNTGKTLPRTNPLNFELRARSISQARLPSRAAVDAIFKRAGLVEPRQPHHRGQTPFARSYAAKEPGDLMTIDFKGQFRLGNGHYCYPLTLMDYTNRFLLECRGLRSTAFDGVWKALLTVTTIRKRFTFYFEL